MMFRQPPLSLRSARSPQEVLALIESQAERDRLVMWFKIKPFWKPVLARLDGHRFRLRQHRNFGNSYGPLLYGEVLADGSGSEIRARFRMHPLALGFLLLWLAGVAAFGVIGTLQTPSPGDSPRWVWPLVSLAFAGFALLQVRFGRWLGKNERRTLCSFLEEVSGTAPSD
jgi:hypothetical protein